MPSKIRKLSAKEVELLARLDVFVTSFTFEAAIQICCCESLDEAQIRTLLSDLVRDGILGKTSGLEERYTFEQGLCAEWEDSQYHELRRAHFEWYVERAETLSDVIRCGDTANALTKFEQDYANIRAALTWGTKFQQEQQCLRLAVACFRFWHSRGRLCEGITWFERALEVGAGTPSLDRAKALNFCGVLLGHNNEPERAFARLTQALSIGRLLRAPEVTAAVYGNLAIILRNEAKHAEAIEMQQESVTVAREIGDPVRLITGLSNLAVLLLEDMRLGEAAGALKECRRLSDEEPDEFNEGVLKLVEAYLALQHGQVDEAETALEHAIKLFSILSDHHYTAQCLSLFIDIAHARGSSYRLAVLLGAAEAARERVGADMPPSEMERSLEMVGFGREALGDLEFDEAWDQGYAMAPEEAADFARGAFPIK